MTHAEAIEMLDHLLRLDRETEWWECKEAKNEFSTNELGKYFSALSNEANLNGRDFGWLAFGVANDGSIVGTNYRNSPFKLDSLKREIAAQTSNSLTFIDIYDIQYSSEKRVLLFQIPPALRGMPTGWKGHYYGRDGESLGALNFNELERIRAQMVSEDWSAAICPQASMDDLHPRAIQKARKEYVNKYPSREHEVRQWDDITFLNKIKVSIKGKITNSAVILLGREEAAPLISPALAKISWVLKDAQNHELDYEHFGPPFFLSVNRLFRRVRNLTFRHLPSGSLFPDETTQYDPWVIREALHNCIAHQDYALRGRINVVETPNALLFSNMGSFLPGSVERVIQEDAPPEVYRNPFLADAMVNLNMIDTQGGGIKRMYQMQMKRFFPLPAYNLEDPKRVVVKIHGEILDEQYSIALMQKANLDLWTVILLDKVQRNIQISKEDADILRNSGLIEGRYPKLFVSAQIADTVDKKAQYLHNRGLDETHYAKLIIEHINQFGSITRKEADALLYPKLPEILDEKQKKNKINRLLSVVLKGKIVNTGSKRKPKYEIVGD
ncbi:putative transcriptional regulator [Desulfatibacillum aliphaticivorans]|uniref:Transcriptional regulator n=1 Tax=Desulfatibacillum aliphaticivorans TaxID=218208 RepID=B8F9N3_DESAL|nr:RNA-binding domain-containing protein [Desulfatibacillum aliphaticivorans]ACL02979.1 putative transcriptional regulator [Desulfatibacillum aliphaticivorans]